MLARRTISAPLALAYVVAQSLGALAGGLLVSTMSVQTDVAVVAISAIGPGWGLSESLATGGFVLVVAGALATQPQAAPLLAGGFGAAMVLCTVSGGMANPAVMAARAFAQTPGGIAPVAALTLAAWQLVGALVALVPALWLFSARNA